MDAWSDRQKDIMELLSRDGGASVASLAAAFDVSTMTIRRDLDLLQSRGLLRRAHGYAVLDANTSVEFTYEYRRSRETVAKSAVARAASANLKPGSTLFVDDSTTCLALAPLLIDAAPLTVFTYFLPMVHALKGCDDIELHVIGGKFRSWSDASVGGEAVRQVEDLSVDLMFMSAPSVQKGRVYHHDRETGEIKDAMFRSSREKFLLVDHSKFDRPALYAMRQLNEFDRVYIDAADAALRAELAADGVEFELAAPPQEGLG